MMEHHRQRISLDLLRGFEAAARHLNFTHAAAELFVTQSAVSRQIKTLEEQLGKKLFVRDNRQLALTEAGLSLQQAVVQAQDVLYAALDRVRPQPRATSLVVAVAEPFASLVLAPALGNLRLLSALKELRIVSANDPDEHARARPHVTIRHYRQDAAPSGAIELAPDIVAPACSPKLLHRAGGALSRPADLAQHVLLRYEAVIERRTRVDWVRWLAAQGLSGLRPRTWIHFMRYDQVISAAVNGGGVMLGRLPLLAGLLREGLLTVPWADCAIRTGSWYATIDTQQRDDGAAQAFVEQVRALFQPA
jgi:DNA-binding transcriptional LysR family regulator